MRALQRSSFFLKHVLVSYICPCSRVIITLSRGMRSCSQLVYSCSIMCTGSPLLICAIAQAEAMRSVLLS